MEGFSRIDIFDTKGTEYLFVIGYLIILILFWKLVNRQAPVREYVSQAVGNLTTAILRVPRGMFYHRNHTWAHLEVSGLARVGMDDLLQHITGPVTFDKLREPGESIGRGELLTELRQDGKILQIFSPISGEIADINPSLKENPEAFNEDPFSEGWVYRVKPTRWVEETSSCLLAEHAAEWEAGELGRFKDFLAGSMKKHHSEPTLVMLQDGGELRDHTLSAMPEEVWKEFQQEFLDPAV
jgi:glycine cleavage system H protein